MSRPFEWKEHGPYCGTWAVVNAEKRGPLKGLFVVQMVFCRDCFPKVIKNMQSYGDAVNPLAKEGQETMAL